MAWTQEQVQFLKDNMHTMSYQQIGDALGKHHKCISGYIYNHNLLNGEVIKRPKKPAGFVPTADDRAKITLLAKYIGFGLKRGASPGRAVEGAMSAIRDAGR